MAYLALAPARAVSDIARVWFKSPLNPLSHTPVGRNVAASAELFERLTRRYGKPVFGLDETVIDGRTVPIIETIVWERTFCRLLHFERQWPQAARAAGQTSHRRADVGPLRHAAAGHGRGVSPFYDVYITDWADARMVPIARGGFDLADYIDYLIDIFRLLSARKDGLPLHTIGVCQPAVPLLAAVAHLEKQHDPDVPASMVLMGGPIDTRRSPTAVNKIAEARGSKWFKDHCIHPVPYPYPGARRLVYPGFLQLSGFMAMNFDRHVNAHIEMFNHLMEGDGDSAEKHREFYDEYLAVMDLTAEFYLQTIETVFVRHLLPEGKMTHDNQFIDLTAINRTALMTVEGEKDDISGLGQPRRRRTSASISRQAEASL